MSAPTTNGAPKPKPKAKFTIRAVTDHEVVNNHLWITCDFYESIIGDQIPADGLMDNAVVVEYLATTKNPPIPLPNGRGWVNQAPKVKFLDIPEPPLDPEEKKHKIVRIFKADGVKMVEYKYNGATRQMTFNEANAKIPNRLRDHLCTLAFAGLMDATIE
ncbi:uncharacterized protein LOC62_04G006506 [Vanrija pseudolonga]|uniref:Uncharacterized protein n=1 Tax=Vanrija pseudolonga TaxID=143232 RepID=A0AAF0YEG9_9TREE|nr:hypothetical protein LOC62_04G006506 [Vanrija pseudolonga]